MMSSKENRLTFQNWALLVQYVYDSERSTSDHPYKRTRSFAPEDVILRSAERSFAARRR
jgi:hypothetical protein